MHSRKRKAPPCFIILFLFLSLISIPAKTSSFRNDVMAVLSKAGCNAGQCHGNANGKAGFKLSLRGESPDLDYFALTHDQFGRRVNPVSPETSLILLKPTTQLAHEGGLRFKKDSLEYKILLDWITQDCPRDPSSVPKLAQLDVSPRDRVISAPEDSVQIRAVAIFSDGTRRNVTGLAVYEPADTLVKVSHDGEVQRQGFGETTVLVRYLQLQVPVRLAFIPARPNFVWDNPPANNFIDLQVASKLKLLRIHPSSLCSEEVFLRRVYLDLIGLLPTAQEAKAFVADPSPDKRARVIDRLLERPEFADFWALKWSDLLRNEERVLDHKGVELFNRWIRDAIARNKPIDEFARELIAARGSTYQNPAANYYRANRDPISRAVTTAQVFLGTRLQCAQCHNHPFDRWTQEDYYDWAGVFSRVQYKVLQNRRTDSNDGHEFKGEQVVYIAAHGEVKNPRTGKIAPPRFLGETSAEFSGGTADDDSLERLANWITSPQNPLFATAQVNRIWFHLMGRGLVDPIDDFRATNPPSHPELLKALTQEFIDHHYNLRHIIRLIANSRTYQLSSQPDDTNEADEINYSHVLPRRLTAEQLLDCQSEVTAVPVSFPGYPAGMRAAQVPGALPENKRGQKTNPTDLFLASFGKPPRLLSCECERSNETTMSQAFQMISGQTINDLLDAKNNRLDQLLSAKLSDTDIVAELYWTALTRPPKPEELKKSMAVIQSAKEKRAALEDIAWALLNAKEFILRY